MFDSTEVSAQVMTADDIVIFYKKHAVYRRVGTYLLAGFFVLIYPLFFFHQIAGAHDRNLGQSMHTRTIPG
jgi:hypothetical protein